VLPLFTPLPVPFMTAEGHPEMTPPGESSALASVLASKEASPSRGGAPPAEKPPLPAAPSSRPRRRRHFRALRSSPRGHLFR
jgi:hypothetical protein